MPECHRQQLPGLQRYRVKLLNISIYVQREPRYKPGVG